MILRPWGEKVPDVLISPWTILGKEARIIKLFNPILSSAQVMSISGGEASVAENMMGDLIQLAREGKDPVKIVINSPGGSVQAGFTILLFMEHLKACGIDIWTVNIGNANSMAGIILAMGTKGRRYALDNTTTHVHEVQISGLGGKGTDIDKMKEHIDHQRDVIERLLAEHTKIPEFAAKELELGIDEKRVKEDPKARKKLVREFSGSENLLTASKALEAGMIDEILKPGNQTLNDIFLIPSHKEEKQ